MPLLNLKPVVSKHAVQIGNYLTMPFRVIRKIAGVASALDDGGEARLSTVRRVDLSEILVKRLHA